MSHVFYIICLLLSTLRVASQMSSPGAIDKIPNASGQYIMLTFDDGPHGTLTPQLLDILRAKKAKVNFYVFKQFSRLFTLI